MSQSKTATRTQQAAAAHHARAAAGIDANTPTWAVTIIQRLGKMERSLEELKRQAKVNSGLEQKGCDLVVQQLEAIRELLGPTSSNGFVYTTEHPPCVPFAVRGLAPTANVDGVALALANARTNWDKWGDPLLHASHCNYFCTYDGPCTCDESEATMISKVLTEAHDARVRAWAAGQQEPSTKPYPRFMWAIRAWRRWTGR